jgi:hypothetical protein
MGTSASAPPADGTASKEDALEELDMTSVMDGAQTRELQRAARLASQADRGETTRPPPAAATAVIEAEVSHPAALRALPDAPSIPVAAPNSQPAVPSVAASSVSASSVSASSVSASPVAVASTSWFVVVAFVLLAAAIAFQLR